MIDGIFLVPSYYKEFICKGKDCRNCCCSGWNITLTMNDYSKLMNLECSDELKDKIKNGISIFPNANKDRYAKIDMNYYGECKLRLENGWCGLQCEAGEENIPSVCRYYPRGIRQLPQKECSISNSCEWVIEYLSKDLDKITFENKELVFYFNNEEDIKIYNNEYDKIRKDIFNIFSNRDKSILERFNELSNYLSVDLSFINNELLNDVIDKLKYVYHHSYSIGDYIKEDSFNYLQAIELIKNKIDNFEIYAEKIFINHMFFMRFPFINTLNQYEYSLIGLYFTYMFYISILSKNLDKNFIDLTANFFRTAEHANMYDIINNNVSRLK